MELPSNDNPIINVERHLKYDLLPMDSNIVELITAGIKRIIDRVGTYNASFIKMFIFCSYSSSTVYLVVYFPFILCTPNHVTSLSLCLTSIKYSS